MDPYMNRHICTIIAYIYGLYLYLFIFHDLMSKIRDSGDRDQIGHLYGILCQESRTPLRSYAIRLYILHYVPDSGMSEERVHPAEAVWLGTSDCEEMAAFHYDCLDYDMDARSYERTIYGIYTKDSGHATCVVTDTTGRVWTLGSFGLIEHDSTDDALNYFYGPDTIRTTEIARESYDWNLL